MGERGKKYSRSSRQSVRASSPTGRLAQWTAECWRRANTAQSRPRPCFTREASNTGQPQNTPHNGRRRAAMAARLAAPRGHRCGRFSYLSISTRLARSSFPYQRSLRETSAFRLYLIQLPQSIDPTRFSGRTFQSFFMTTVQGPRLTTMPGSTSSITTRSSGHNSPFADADALDHHPHWPR